MRVTVFVTDIGLAREVLGLTWRGCHGGNQSAIVNPVC